MKAVVMAGGEGSRLRPLTVDRPKPMVHIANAPVMEHIVRLLQRHGIRDIVVTVQYLSGVIQDYFREGQDLDARIRYSLEEIPLGTAGSVRAAEAYLDEPFLVISGDALTDFDLTALIEFHEKSGAAATLTLHRVRNPLEYGVVITDDSGRILRFQEKPRWDEVLGDTVNTGIYMIDPSIFDLIPKDRPFDFSNDVFPEMLRLGLPLYGFVAEGYWTDVGTVDEYRRANSDAVNGKAGIDLPQPQGGLMPGEGAEIHPDAKLFGNILVGRNCQIGEGAVINGPTVVGDYVVIDSAARIDQSVLLANSYVGRKASLRSCVVGRQSTVHEGARIEEAALLGDNCIVGRDSTVRAAVKIWPNKRIDDGTVVTETLIHGSQARRSPFGRSGITGLANIEMTPEFAARVGAAVGSVLKPTDRVVANRDPSRAARMIKRALMAGLTSTGVTVLDIGALPTPAARFRAGMGDVDAAVHVRSSPHEASSVDIKLLGADGSDLEGKAERSIDSIMAREDFRRVPIDQIGEISVVDVHSDYTNILAGALDVEAVRRSAPALVIDYAGGAAEAILPAILNQSDCSHVAVSGSGRHRDDLSTLSRITAAVGADMGVHIDTDGASIEVVDGSGKALGPNELTGVLLALQLVSNPGATFCIPGRTPAALGRHLVSLGANLVWTSGQPQSIMLESRRHRAAVGTDAMGAFCFPSVHTGFDGLLTTLKLAEALAKSELSLADLARSLPKMWQVELQVPCLWEKRAAVMQVLNDPGRPRLPEFGEGLIFGGPTAKSRTVLLPLRDKPSIAILSEAEDAISAERNAAEWEATILTAQK